MPISLTCSCGSRLEIDDKFAGQSIPCPDCNKRLLAQPPLPPPTRTSGLAVFSLLLALVGAFTVVGTLAAVACGAIAQRQLSRRREPIGGIRIAQAAMVLGIVFTALAVAAYASRSLLGIDSLARQLAWTGKLDFSGKLTLTKAMRGGDNYQLERPSAAWGLTTFSSTKESDHFMLVNPHDDAQIVVMSDNILGRDDDAASQRSRALEAFRNSDLVRLIGRMPQQASETWKERGLDEGNRTQEFLIDLPLGGIPRTFWFRLEKQGDLYFNILVCGARTHRFGRLQADFRRSLDSFKRE